MRNMLMFLLLDSFIIELLLYSKLFWKLRIPIIALLACLVPAASVLLFIFEPSWLTGLVLLLGLSRVFNYLRIAQARMHESYLIGSTRLTGLWLMTAQVTALIVSQSSWDDLLAQPLQLSILQLLAALIVLASSARNLHKSRYIHDTTYLSDKELPTVTVAIPARNETTDLQACLTTVLASNYPKLEILVLDDCSQLKTSEIIKSFAHAGVRFIKGAEPSERWLAKNQAYARLADESSGELIFFCGVDVRLGPNAIRALVTTMQVRKKRMINVLPRRLDGSLGGAFLQSMRYWWELALPRRLFNRPPVLSTAWLIERAALEKLGGFAAVSHQIIPESYFARELASSGDDYSFMRASNDLDVQSVKTSAEQWASAVRVSYPQIRRRPEMALLLTSLHLILLLGALPTAAWAYVSGDLIAFTCSLVATICLISTHILILHSTNPGSTWTALLSFPAGVMGEIVAGLVSMIRYEFGTVEWKDRNVCLPVMHAQAIPHRSKRKR